MYVVDPQSKSICKRCGCEFGDWRTVFAKFDHCPSCNKELFAEKVAQVNRGADQYCRKTYGCGNYDPSDGDPAY